MHIRDVTEQAEPGAAVPAATTRAVAAWTTTVARAGWSGRPVGATATAAW
jgi:hypothetical protein